MSTSSVQFKGIEAVVEAFENRNVPAWSLWQGKQFMFKNEGGSMEESAEALRETLSILANSSNAIYTLKVYEDFTGKIKSNTPDDGSFNFRLNQDTQEITNSQYTGLRNQNEVLQRLGAIEEKLNKAEEDYEEEEEKPHRLGLIGEIMNDPGLSPIVMPLILKAFGIGSAPQLPKVAAISGVNDDAVLKNAIEVLKSADPKLAEHLMKLAQLSKENPQSFHFLINTLDQM